MSLKVKPQGTWPVATKDFTVDCDITATVKSLKEKIATQLSSTASDVRLVCCGKILSNDEATLESFGVHNDATVYCVKQLAAKAPSAAPAAPAAAASSAPTTLAQPAQAFPMPTGGAGAYGLPDLANVTDMMQRSMSGNASAAEQQQLQQFMQTPQMQQQMQQQAMSNPEVQARMQRIQNLMQMQGMGDQFTNDPAALVQSLGNLAQAPQGNDGYPDAAAAMAAMQANGNPMAMQGNPFAGFNPMALQANTPAPAASPAPVADIPEALWQKLKAKYSEKLQELVDMGFEDEKANLKTLNKTQGDIDRAVEILSESAAEPKAAEVAASSTEPKYEYEEGEVVAHVYDVSGGMAHSTSQMIIGKYMELLPHTGIVCFGKEYYFSQNTAECEPGKSLPSAVKKTIQLGKTTKTKEEFQEFLESLKSQFTSESYNFLSHNSNHYADALAKFLLDGEGIPKELLSTMDELQSTPQGRRMAEMLAGMQQGMLTPTGSIFHGGTPTSPMFANMFNPGAFGAQSSAQQQRFTTQLAELAEMGFTDRQICLQALMSTNGNMEESISIIISQSANSIS